ncbi:uncharacterized protein PHACADRAFT_166193 [Phanerochaete carnosa HHB-10118-sp]|uniref:MYND-type domain-containing protein n=1 Tax=Phanerochaete carnosa (strain HHB-10118-sp) TaxID=650164 RepID=K5VVB6_PHACS|nr:uncharacterized protein PHACADRAFT_166193 [Phanerochaete carnosa HHB-10118-sp]EKM50514.1 hypothetical protein PHACADRAFT_166193 [Phanerochaete carnosa HHB-10118-sp]
MNTNSLISHPCTLCCMPTTMWCSRCQNAWYCSPDHLSSDWPRHKRECAPVNAAAAQQQPYNMIATPAPVQQELIAVSALLFTPEEERSKIISVQCRPQGTLSQGICPLPLSMPPNTIILTQGLNGEALRFPLHIWYCPVALQRGSPVNRAIFRITSGAAEKAWCGPVVVLKFNGSRRQGYTDAGSNDLPALSAYFLAYK